MKEIISSVIILILSISLLFGTLAFAEWNVDPGCWDVGTRIIGSFFGGGLFVSWIAFVVNMLISIFQRQEETK